MGEHWDQHLLLEKASGQFQDKGSESCLHMGISTNDDEERRTTKYGGRHDVKKDLPSVHCLGLHGMYF